MILQRQVLLHLTPQLYLLRKNKRDMNPMLTLMILPSELLRLLKSHLKSRWSSRFTADNTHKLSQVTTFIALTISQISITTALVVMTGSINAGMVKSGNGVTSSSMMAPLTIHFWPASTPTVKLGPHQASTSSIAEVTKTTLQLKNPITLITLNL